MSGQPLESGDLIRFIVKNASLGPGSVLNPVLGQADVDVGEVMKNVDGVTTKALPLVNLRGQADKARGTLHVLIGYGDAKLPEIQKQGK